MVFQDFQRERQILDEVAKQVTGLPNVKVRDPETFAQFVQQSQPQPENLQPEQAPVFGQGGLIDPQRAKEFGLGLVELLSYASPFGESIRQTDIGGQPLYEAGSVQQPLIDPRVAMDFAARAGGPEIPEAVPFIGGMTPLEAGAGGLAALTSPLDVALTAGTVGLGPAVSGAIKSTRAALPATKLGKTAKAVLKPAEIITEPVAKGSAPRRLAGEVALTAPTTTAITGTQKRQEEDIAYGFENAASAIAAGILTTGAGAVALPKVSQVNIPRIKNAFKQSDFAYAKTTDDGLDPDFKKEILDDPVFNAHYQIVTRKQKAFIDKYLDQTTRSSALTDAQKDFLYKKLLTTYNTRRLEEVSKVLDDTDPAKLEIGQVLKTVEDFKTKPQKNNIVDYEETVNSNLKGKVADVIVNDNKVIKILKSSLKYDPEARTGDAVLNDTQQGILDRLMTAIKTGDVQSAAVLEAASKEKKRRIETARKLAYDDAKIRGKNEFEAMTEAKIEADKVAKDIAKEFEGVTTKIEYRPNTAGVPTYKTIIPKTGIPEFIKTMATKQTSYNVVDTTLFRPDEVLQLTKAIDENLPNSLDRMDAIQALIKLMGDPTYSAGQKRFGTKPFTRTRTTPGGIEVQEQSTLIGEPRLTLEGMLPTGKDLQLLKKVFGKEFVDTINQFKRDPNQPSRVFQTFDLLWNIPRTLKATFDMSAFLLQAGFQVLLRPGIGVKSLRVGLADAFKPIIETFFSGDFLRNKQRELFSDPKVIKLIDNGLESTDNLSPILSQREEAFLPNLIEKLPSILIVPSIVRGASRFHGTFLNTIRAEAARKVYSQAESLGIQMTDDVVSDIAKYANWTTGRGPTETPFGKIPPDVLASANRLLFSARLQLSRIVFPFIGLLPGLLGKSPIRRIVLKEKLKYYTMLGIILGLGRLSGGEVDIPKGKIRWGNVSLDFDSGNNQYLELFADLIFPDDKASTGIDYTKKRNEILKTTGLSKANPSVSYLAEIMTGQDFFGNDIDWKEYNPVAFDSKERWLGNAGKASQKYLLPLNIVGMIEAYRTTSNPYLTGLVGAADSIGVMAQAYVNKNDISRELFDKDYTELFPFEQKFVTTMYFADDRVDRDMPTSLQFEKAFQDEMYALLLNYKAGNLSKDQVVRNYFNRKDYKYAAKDANNRIQYGWDEQDREDYEFEEYTGGTEAQKTALRQHYDILETPGVQLLDAEGEPTRLINWDAYSKVKRQIAGTWTTEQQKFVAANTLVYESLIPEEIFVLLPSSHQRKIIESIKARQELLEDRLDMNLQSEFDDAFEQLNNK